MADFKLVKRIRIGRKEGKNDVVLDHPSVAAVHAEIVRTKNGPRLRDLSHMGGTRLNGVVTAGGLLADGDEVAAGPFRFRFRADTLSPIRDDLAPTLGAFGVGVSTVLGKVLLAPTSLQVRPGELLALVGPSGAGKSTLLRVLAGVDGPTAGQVFVGDDAVSARLGEIGYVPQSDTVHEPLSAREGLRYAAALRLPDDTPGRELDEAVERVLRDVDLVAHGDAQVRTLSGGQRKRVALALELISRPSLMMLDEPTAGLDPGLEGRMMRLARSLADDGTSVVVVTHATRSLHLCDRVGIMAPGGRLVYLGPFAQAAAYFSVDDFDDIYGAIEDNPARWPRYVETDAGAPPAAAPSATATRRVRPQALILTRRLVQLMSRDRRNLTIMLAQAVGLGIATGLLFRSGVFDRPAEGGGHAGEAAQLLFLMVTIAIWFGAIGASRQIVGERAIVEREFATGVRIESYLLSKAIVLGAVTAIQVLVFTLIVFTLRPVHDPASAPSTILQILVLTAWVGAAMGLVISAWARTEDQAASLIPVALIPQLLFGGAIVPVHQMGFLMRAASVLFFSRWSFAGAGSTIDMNGRIDDDPALSQSDRYGHGFFSVGWLGSELVLVVFLVVFAAILFWALRGEPNPRQLWHRARARLAPPA